MLLYSVADLLSASEDSAEQLSLEIKTLPFYWVLMKSVNFFWVLDKSLIFCWVLEKSVIFFWVLMAVQSLVLEGGLIQLLGLGLGDEDAAVLSDRSLVST